MRSNLQSRLNKIEAAIPTRNYRVFQMITEVGENKEEAEARFMADNDLDPNDPNVLLINHVLVAPLNVSTLERAEPCEAGRCPT